MAGMFSQEHTERIKTLFYKFDEQGAGFIKIFETALIFNALGERVRFFSFNFMKFSSRNHKFKNVNLINTVLHSLREFIRK